MIFEILHLKNNIYDINQACVNILFHSLFKMTFKLFCTETNTELLNFYYINVSGFQV